MNSWKSLITSEGSGEGSGIVPECRAGWEYTNSVSGKNKQKFYKVQTQC